jgi:hypothetical protein
MLLSSIAICLLCCGAVIGQEKPDFPGSWGPNYRFRAGGCSQRSHDGAVHDASFFGKTAGRDGIRAQTPRSISTTDPLEAR